MNTLEQKLDAAIRKLELLPGAEKKIPAAISQLQMISLFAAANDKAPALECGSDQAQKELEQFIKLGTKLHNHITTMHQTSRNRLRSSAEAVAPELLQSDIRKMITLADTATSQLQDIPNVKKGYEPINYRMDVWVLTERDNVSKYRT